MEMVKSKLAYIFTGTSCPMNCNFCYYKAHSQQVGFSDIIKQLFTYKRNGFSGIEFSGGESSALLEYPLYLKSARDIGFERISTVTSGYGFNDIGKFIEYIDNGLNDLLVSTHGYDAESYERITGNRNYYVKDVLDNALALEFPVRVNCIINNSIGVDFCEKYNNFIMDYPNVTDINFILVNSFSDCDDHCDRRVVNQFISDIAEYDTSNVKLRYFPYCHVGTMQDITYNYPRQVFDQSDWNVGTMGNVPDGCDDPDQFIINKSRELYYTKSKDCEACIYSEVCDGIKTGWDIQPAPIIGRKKVSLKDL